MPTSASSIPSSAWASPPSRRACTATRGSSPVPHDLVIRGRAVAPDPWRYVGVASADELAQALPDGPIAVPLDYWLEHGGLEHGRELARRGTPVGVWLKP